MTSEVIRFFVLICKDVFCTTATVVGVHGQLVPLHILCWTLRVPQYFRGFGATKTLWV